MNLSRILWFLITSAFSAASISAIAQDGIDASHIYYYSTVEFVETPLSPIKGSVPLTKKEAMKRLHYRFVYNDKHQLISVSFFNGNTPRNPNHTANHFTLAHEMKFEYSDTSESISFFNEYGQRIEVLGNCSRFVYTHNDLGYRNSLYFLDKKNDRITNGWGIYEYRWTYLDDGSVIENRFDKEGNPVTIRPGFEFYRLRLYFNPSGHITLMQNIDKDGNLVENSTGAAQDRITTNAQGNFLEWNVLNKYNELKRGNGPNVAIGKQAVNKYGYEIGLENQDENHQVIASRYGFFMSKTKHDQFGNIIERTFFDAEGNPTKHGNAGYHKLVLSWDKDGNKRKNLRYFDVDGKPCSHATRGYHSATYEYDDQGRISKISYLSTTNDLFNRLDNGRAYTVFEYVSDNYKPELHHFNKSNVKIQE